MTEEEPEITGELRNWMIETIFEHMICSGKCYNDSKNRFDDGEMIRTSYIVKLDVENRLLYTRNSIYRLA